MEGGRFGPRGVGEALGGSARRRGETHDDTRAHQRSENRANDRGLAHTRAAGDDQNLPPGRLFDRRPLLRRELDARARLEVGDRGGDAGERDGARAGQLGKARRQTLFGGMHLRREDGAP